MKLKKISSVNNPKSIHGIFPYRGKISAVEANAVLSQLKKGSTILDPFCGSGTILYEANKSGFKSIGVDNNPICKSLSLGKISINKKLDFEIKKIQNVIVLAKRANSFNPMPEISSKHFHKNTAEQIMRVYKHLDNLTPYGLACFYGAIALAARGCNHYKWTSSTVGKDIKQKRNIDIYEKLLNKIKKHHYPLKNPKNSIFYEKDSRRLSEFIKPNSVDFVFTSPPYFNCLDYTAYYTKIIYNIEKKDRNKIRANLLQSYSEYEKNMTLILNELKKVLKMNGRLIFVVGDKKVNGRLIRGEDFFDKISPFKKIDSLERIYTGTSSSVFDNLNKTTRKEQIIIWEKNEK